MNLECQHEFKLDNMLGGSFCAKCRTLLPSFIDEQVRAHEIADAVAAERERCAKIALSLCSDDTTQCEREGENGCRARRISLMIRKG